LLPQEKKKGGSEKLVAEEGKLQTPEVEVDACVDALMFPKIDARDVALRRTEQSCIAKY
jgi:hypothetical protein